MSKAIVCSLSLTQRAKALIRLAWLGTNLKYWPFHVLSVCVFQKEVAVVNQAYKIAYRQTAQRRQKRACRTFCCTFCRLLWARKMRQFAFSKRPLSAVIWRAASLGSSQVLGKLIPLKRCGLYLRKAQQGLAKRKDSQMNSIEKVRNILMAAHGKPKGPIKLRAAVLAPSPHHSRADRAKEGSSHFDENLLIRTPVYE